MTVQPATNPSSAPTRTAYTHPPPPPPPPDSLPQPVKGKRPLVKAPAKTKPKEKKTPAPAPAAPRPVQKAKPPTVKKAPPVAPMEIQESLPTTPPPPSAALELAPLESRGEEPFRTPEGTGHGRKKRKRKSIFSPDSPPLPSPPSRNTETQTATPPGPSLNSSQVQTDPVPDRVPMEKPEDQRLLLSREATSLLEAHKSLPPPACGTRTNWIKPSSRPLPSLVMVQTIEGERFEHDIHNFTDMKEFLEQSELACPDHFIAAMAARLIKGSFQDISNEESKLANLLLAGVSQ
ncbi:pollen-specific leucine-rich repeat extensin-like protein 1 [Haliotis rufescens]|uniref:pollen-specific leucine-rich repeat extensin-like protein 1 n=1 Tax=Haliotis rufescens TaxID=6454 RepID=UPI00201F4887|nr:pollen-specific leucine-rich repeat extensin-like protein 1 [Haliotis rufescens]